MPPKGKQTQQRKPTTPDRVAEVEDVEDVEPTAEEQGASIVFVKTGYIRVTVNGQTYRLRPPLFGEHRDLRHAIQASYDEAEGEREIAEVRSAEIRDEFAAIAADEQKPPGEAKWSNVERVRMRAALRQEDLRIARTLNEATDERMIRWWIKVWDTLLDQGPRPVWLDGEDLDSAPPWLAGAILPNRVLDHWRQAPLVRG